MTNTLKVMKFMKWINVKDMLPEDVPEYKNRKVIECIVALSSCYKNGKHTFQKRQRKKIDIYGKGPTWVWSRGDVKRITHWMIPDEPI